MTQKLLQIGGLLGIIALAFIFNAIVSLFAGAILHVGGFSDFIAVGGAVITSVIVWNVQFKSLNDLLGK